MYSSACRILDWEDASLCCSERCCSERCCSEKCCSESFESLNEVLQQALSELRGRWRNPDAYYELNSSSGPKQDPAFGEPAEDFRRCGAL